MPVIGMILFGGALLAMLVFALFPLMAEAGKDGFDDVE